MIKLTGIIQTFEPIFERLGITYYSEASIYYVLSISNSSLNFTETLREARKIRRTISQRALINGRNHLLNKGFMANVLLIHNVGDEFEQKGYYIPIHPRIIFEENEEYLREIYEPEDFSLRKKQVENFYSIYETNYGRYGLKIEEGCMALYYNDAWIASYIASIIARADVEMKTLSMILSGSRIFKPEYRHYYEDKIKSGLKIRMALGGSEEIEEVEEMKELRNRYEDNVEIRYTGVISRTSKSFIIDRDLAMDGKNILSMDGGGYSYIGIVYIRDEGCIKNLSRDFESVWKMSKVLL
jgi:hypothetical protein